MVTCTSHVLSPVDYLGEGVEVMECLNGCGEFVIDGDTLVPVVPSVTVPEAIADSDRDAWDGLHHGHGLAADPHWGRLDEPA